MVHCIAHLIEMGNAMKLANTQAASQQKQQQPKGVNCLTAGSRRNNPQDKTNKPSSCMTPSVKSQNCRGNYPHARGKTACPAHGRECTLCRKLNHFQSVHLQQKCRLQKPPVTRQTE